MKFSNSRDGPIFVVSFAECRKGSASFDNE